MAGVKGPRPCLRLRGKGDWPLRSSRYPREHSLVADVARALRLTNTSLSTGPLHREAAETLFAFASCITFSDPPPPPPPLPVGCVGAISVHVYLYCIYPYVFRNTIIVGASCTERTESKASCLACVSGEHDDFAP